MKCLVCGFEVGDARSLGGHVKLHGLSAGDYRAEYGLERRCSKCGRLLSKQCRKGSVCKACYDWTGKNNPFFGKRHSEATIEKIKEKTTAASEEKWKDPVYRGNVVRAVSKPRRDGFGAEQSERVSRWYSNNPIQRKIRSRHMRKSWEDGKIEPSIHSCCESKVEKKMRERIRLAIPGGRVVKKTIRIEGRWYLPDVMVNDRVIVEFFGNFWHANPKIYRGDEVVHHGKRAGEIWAADGERISAMERAGYKVIVVWEDVYDRGLDVESLVRMAEEQAKPWEKE